MEEIFIVKDVLRKNIFETFDIVITKPKFLCSNIENVQVFLLDLDGNLINKLNGLEYELVASSYSIYKNILTIGTNLFTNSNIPFAYNIYHLPKLIIYNLSNQLGLEIKDYQIKFTYNLSNTLQNYPPNQIPPIPYEIKWNCGINEQNEDKNTIRFMHGMMGCSCCPTQSFDKDYLHKNKRLLISNETLNPNDYYCINISHLDESNEWVENYGKEHNSYQYDKLINLLVYQSDIADNIGSYSKMISETSKVPVWSGHFEYNPDNLEPNNSESNNLKSKYKVKIDLVGGIDAITNIQFLCDNKKYLFNSICLITTQIQRITNEENNITTYSSVTNDPIQFEFDKTDYGYKILGLDNFLIIPIVPKQLVILEIEFNLVNNCQDEFDFGNLGKEYDLVNIDINVNLNENEQINLYTKPIDFWVRYDRIAFDTEPRRNLAQSSLDYEEYPIVDIIDYYPEKITLNQNNLNNQNIPLNLNSQNIPLNLNNLNNLNQNDNENNQDENNQNDNKQDKDNQDEDNQDEDNQYENEQLYFELHDTFYKSKIYSEIIIYLLIILMIFIANYFN